MTVERTSESERPDVDLLRDLGRLESLIRWRASPRALRPDRTPVISGNAHRSLLTPDLAYGRHRGPARASSRMAAVMVGLFQSRSPEHRGQWVIPLTLRPPTMVHHGGQISLPGGRIESGETARQAAEREYYEELGVPPRTCHCLGSLSTQYVFGSDHLVEPVVAILGQPTEPWHPNPQEVAEVLEVPLAALLDPAKRTTLRRHRRLIRQQESSSGEQPSSGFHFSIPIISVGDHRIWGATAMILDELAHLLLLSREQP